MHLKSFEDMKQSSVFFLLKPVNSIYVFLVSFCLIIASLLIWAIFAPMDDVVKAEVLLRPSQAISSIKCVANGQILTKNFENDSSVQQGELLFSLDTNVYEKELESYEKLYLQNSDFLEIYNVLLNSVQRDSLPDLPKTNEAYVKAASYIFEKRYYETELADAKIKFERERDLPAAVYVRQKVEDLQNQYEQKEYAFESWKNNQLASVLAKLKDLQTERNSIESKISELNRIIKNSTIYAPISGRITETKKLNTGDYILAGEEILRIVPQDDISLIADIYVDSMYIARVKNGNPVKIKFPGLPPSRYGIVETEVLIVPPDMTYSLTNNPVFVVEAKIKEPFLISKDGQIANLIPGISAQARIITDRTTAMRMILRKLDFIK